MATFIDKFMKTYGPEVTQQMAVNTGLDQGILGSILGGLFRKQ
jgi:hypothetical protein